MTSLEQERTPRPSPARSHLIGTSIPLRLRVQASSLRRLARHAQGLRRLADAELDLRGAVATQPELLDAPAVAIVGARAARKDALELARALAHALAAAGRVIVSGGALGVDGAAHEGALDAGGRTVAVLGTGVDVVYPERHVALFGRMVARGGLLSPFPLGTLAKSGHFPTRNPLVAALADALVVVEAGARSGSLGTAQAAIRLGVPLYCRPGSPGCDALIASGRARACFGADELAARLTGAPSASAPPAASLDSDDQRCLDALTALGASSAEIVAARLGSALPLALEWLFSLELSRRIIRLEDGRYLAVPGSEDTKE